MKTPVKKISQYLGCKDVGLGGILRKARTLKAVETLVLQHLDKELAEHCAVTNVKLGAVTISCDSAQWVTMLRFEIPSLLEKCRQSKELASIASIKCKVLPKQHAPKSKPKIPARMSKETGKHIRSLAESMVDEKIKAVLNKLADKAD